MANPSWKYVSPLREGSEVEVLELKYCYQLPNDLRDCIIKNNAGVPTSSAFDMGEDKEKVFGGLLSFNVGDVDSIYDYISLFEIDGGKRLKMLPFALDPAGNFFCIENGKVVFYDHENDKTTVVCNTFTDLLNMLYD